MDYEQSHEPLEPSEAWEDVPGYYLEGDDDEASLSDEGDAGVDLDDE